MKDEKKKKRSRNWMRIFWIGIGFAVVSIPLAGSWWYRANFPVPKSFFAGDPDRKFVQWFMEKRGSWLWKKFSSETLRLNLHGTKWEDEESGAIASFNKDGIFTWIRKPESRIRSARSRPDIAIEEKLENTNFEFLPDRNQFMRWDFDSFGRIGANIVFDKEGSGPIEGCIGTDGRQLGIYVDPLLLIFERRLR